MTRYVRSAAKTIRDRTFGNPHLLMAETEHLRFAIGSLAARSARAATTMRQAEFRAFSQFGEDGIIQWLLGRVPVAHEIFIELGVGDYRESNTRFLLEHDNWRGLVLDAGQAHLQYLDISGLSWRHSVTGRVSFITRENINELLAEVAGDVGLLSIDIDGVDYWVLEAISVITPRILVVEYNSVWGPDRAVTVPYDAGFQRAEAHWSWLYFGASLGAFCSLLEPRGYRLVGSNSTGQNAFFVRNDVAGALPKLTAQQGWVESRIRDSRGPRGDLSYTDSHAERLALMADMPLVDVVSGESLQVGELA